MKTIHPRLTSLGRYIDAEPLRFRAELPALVTARPTSTPSGQSAGHDFLVSNPRPDLTLDPQTLRMLELR